MAVSGAMTICFVTRLDVSRGIIAVVHIDTVRVAMLF